MKVRLLFDNLMQTYPALKSHLLSVAGIVHSKSVEYVFLKGQRKVQLYAKGAKIISGFVVPVEDTTAQPSDTKYVLYGELRKSEYSTVLNQKLNLQTCLCVY